MLLRVTPRSGSWSGRGERDDVAADRRDLVGELVQRARRDADLQVGDPDGGLLAERRRHLLRRTARRVRGDVPAGVADVEEPAAVDGERPGATRLLPLAAEQLDGAIHADLRRTLGDPAVSQAGGAAQGGVGGPTDPDGRSTGTHRPGRLADLAGAELVLEGGPDGADGLVGDAAPLVERH